MTPVNKCLNKVVQLTVLVFKPIRTLRIAKTYLINWIFCFCFNACWNCKGNIQCFYIPINSIQWKATVTVSFNPSIGCLYFSQKSSNTQQNKIRIMQFISHTYYIQIVGRTFKKNCCVGKRFHPKIVLIEVLEIYWITIITKKNKN